VKRFVRWLNLGFALLFAACSPPRHPSLSAEFTPRSRAPTDAELATGGIMVVADNQMHYLFGEPTLFRTRFTDAWVSETAIRPPQLDLFGQDWFRAVLKAKTPSMMAVVHLGDALDFACAEEWNEFTRVMTASAVPWAMAPGNHDAYFFGNFEVAPRTTSRGARVAASRVKRLWEASCAGAGGPMRKDRFVKSYLRALAGQLGARDLTPLDPEGKARSWRCRAEECGRSFLQEAVWNIDHGAPWRSFIVQRVNLDYCHVRSEDDLCPPGVAVDGILVDTTDYRTAAGLRLDSLSRAAGKLGSFSAAQRAVVGRWLHAADAASRDAVLMGHHPFHELDESAQTLIDDAVSERQALLYVSAHTHRGGYFVHGSGSDGWLELNVGSVLDWNPHYVLFQLQRSGGRTLLRSQRKLFDEPNSCKDAWEPTPDEPDFFESYAGLGSGAEYDARATQQKVFEVMLAALERFFRCVPKHGEPKGDCKRTSAYDALIRQARSAPTLGEQGALIQALVAKANDSSKFNEEVWSSYRQCQAHWASKYERFEARVPDEATEFMLFPGDRPRGGRQ